MIKLKFNIEINASTESVYSIMLDENYFKEWVSVFSPNSYFEGTWTKGENIIYISPDENGSLHGMISTIQENIPNKEIYIKPCGFIQNGIEILEGEDVEGLAEAYEKYLFIQKDDATELIIEVSVYDELKEYFNETWPLALAMLKSICENSNDY